MTGFTKCYECEIQTNNRYFHRPICELCLAKKGYHLADESTSDNVYYGGIDN